MLSVYKALQEHYPAYTLRKVSKPENIQHGVEWLQKSDENVLLLRLTANMRKCVSLVIPNAKNQQGDIIYVLNKDNHVYFNMTYPPKQVEMVRSLKKFFTDDTNERLQCCVCMKSLIQINTCEVCNASLCTQCYLKMGDIIESKCLMQCPVCRKSKSLEFL